MATVPKHATPLPDGDESFRDGLGVRFVVLDESTGDRVERLVLTPELARHALAVEERTSRLVNFRHARFARLRGVEADAGGEAVWVLAEPVEGLRWFDVLQAAEQGRVTIDVNTALQLAREILPALATLHDSRSVTHGALGPERLVLTPHARLTIVDHGLGVALGKLQYPRTRLWREFRIAVPPAAGVPRFDARADIAMVAMTVLASLVGRPITLNEFPDHVRELLDRARERPVTGRDRPLSPSLRAWLERTLPIESRRPLVTALEAQVALEEAIKKERAYAPGASALKHFVERLGPLVPARPVERPEAPPAAGDAADAARPAARGRGSVVALPGATSRRPARRPTPEEEEAEEIAFLEQELARLAAEEAAQRPAGPEPAPAQPPATTVEPPQASPNLTVVDAGPSARTEEDPLALARLLDDLAASTAEATAQEIVTDEGPAVTEVIAEVPLRLAGAQVVEFSEYGATPSAIDEIGLPSASDFDELDFDSVAEPARSEAPALQLVDWPEGRPVLAAAVPEPLASLAVEPAVIAEPATSSPSLDVVVSAPADVPHERIEVADPGLPPQPEGPVWCLLPPTSGPASEQADGDVDVEAGFVDRDTFWLDFDRMHATRLLAAPGVAVTAVPARRRRPRSRVNSVAATSRRSVLARSLAPLTGVAPRAARAGRAEPSRRAVPQTRQLPASAAAVPAALAPLAPAGRLPDVVLRCPDPLRLVAASCAGVIVAGRTAARLQLTVGEVDGAVALAPLPPPASRPLAPALHLVAPVASVGRLHALLDPTVAPALPSRTVSTLPLAAPPRPGAVQQAMSIGRTLRLVWPAAGASQAARQALPAGGELIEPVALVADEPACAEPAEARGVPEVAEVVDLAPPATVPCVIEPAAVLEEPSPGAAAAVPEELLQGPAALPVADATASAVPEAPVMSEAQTAASCAPGADEADIVSAVAGAVEDSSSGEPRFVPGEGLVLEVSALDVSRLRVAAPLSDAGSSTLVDLEAEIALLESLILEDRAPGLEAVGRPDVERATLADLPVDVPTSPAPPVPAGRDGDAAEPIQLDGVGAASEPGVRPAPEPPAVDTELELAVLMAALREVEDAEEAASQVMVATPAVVPLAVPTVPVASEPALELPVEPSAVQETACADAPAPPAVADVPAAAVPLLALPLAAGEQAVTGGTPPAAHVIETTAPTVAAPETPAPALAAEVEDGGTAARAGESRKRRSRGRGRRRLAAVPAPQTDSSPATVATAATAEPVVPEAPRPSTAVREAWSVEARRPATAADMVAPSGSTLAADDAAQAVMRPGPSLEASVAFEETLPTYAPWLAGDPLPAGAAEASPLSVVGAVPTETERASVYSPDSPPAATPAGGPATPVTGSIRVLPPGAPAAADPAPGRSATGAFALREAVPASSGRARSSAPVLNESFRDSVAPTFGVPTTAAPETRSRLPLVAAVVALLVLAGAGAFWVLRPAETGKLTVEASALGIEVLVDGHVRGTAPVTVELPAGRHAVELRGHGATRSITVEVPAGGATTQRVNWSEGRTRGALKVTSTPPGAKVLIGGELRGVTPVEVDGLAAGQHAVTVQGDGGTVRRTVQVTAGVVTDLDVPISPGWLKVVAPFTMEVREEGHLVGTDDQGRLMFSPGTHRLELSNATYGLTVRRTVEITPYDTTSLTVEAPAGAIEVRAPDGMQVFVDGTARGVTPLPGPLTVTLGTYNVLVTDAAGQIKGRQAVTVKAGGPTPVTF